MKTKTATIAEYLTRYSLDVLVETGLDCGRGSGMDIGVGRYIALDWQQANVEAAQSHGFEARCGDSGDLLPGVLAEFDGPALLWLDAHGVDCGDQHPVTVEGFPGWDAIPLLRELEAVAGWELAPSSVVLIDDMPGMAQWVGVGTNGEATTEAFDDFLDALPVAWARELRDGILRLTPPA